MKRPLINIKKINNNDVIATSGVTSCADLDLNKYNYIFQSNGQYYGSSGAYVLEIKDGNCYINMTQYSGLEPDYYSYTAPTLVDGKWYHLYPGVGYDVGENFVITEESIIVECTVPSHIPTN